jgi:NAD(P)-dependent dehydrogenase (short-subunit alcohol dehydrogenase family)
MKGVNVRVNAIAPGVYESEMTYDSIGPDLVDKVGKGLIPLPSKRAGTWVLLPNLYTDIETITIFSGQEMAGTVVYLASRAGGYTNGQELIIDGGYCAVNPASV